MVAGSSNFHPNEPRDWEGTKLGGMIIGAMLGFVLLCFVVGYGIANIKDIFPRYTVEQNALTGEVHVVIERMADWHLYRHYINQSWSGDDMILDFPSHKDACVWVEKEKKRWADAKAYNKAWNKSECEIW